MAISLNRTQLKEIKNALKDLNLDDKKKQKLLWRLAKYGVIPAVKRHVKEQVNVSGGKFTNRKTKRKKSMLAKMPKLLAIKNLPEKEAVKLYFRGRYKSTASKEISAGVIAGIQQDGATIRQSKSQFKAVKDKTGKSQKELNQGEITKQQIKRLRDLNFEIPGTKKKAPKKWLQNHLTRAHAGLIIRIMKSGKPLKHGEKMPAGAASWAIELPSRVFLGISDIDFSKALARELNRINFG
ncbi:hypothetical protein RHO14_06975 [Orbus wheelerorum]|uniref:hypothetical protein n=1 Tax=Orbus wheelerorum TaxID=3074111 RepID=UPI00370DD7D6